MALLVQARDLDGIRLRAPSSFNRILREVAVGEGALLVDVERAFAARAPAGLVGNQLMPE